jgi:hypothetical protein
MQLEDAFPHSEPPRDASLQPLARLTRLKQLAFSHVFTVPMAEYATLAAALPDTRGDCLRASHALHVRLLCPKCKEAGRVSLTAPHPRTKAQLCPRCDASKLAAHEADFTRLKQVR